MAAFQSEMTIRLEDESRALLIQLIAVLERLAIVLEYQQGKESAAIVHEAVEQLARLRGEVVPGGMTAEDKIRQLDRIRGEKR